MKYGSAIINYKQMMCINGKLYSYLFMIALSHIYIYIYICVYVWFTKFFNCHSLHLIRNVYLLKLSVAARVCYSWWTNFLFRPYMCLIYSFIASDWHISQCYALCCSVMCAHMQWNLHLSHIDVDVKSRLLAWLCCSLNLIVHYNCESYI